ERVRKFTRIRIRGTSGRIAGRPGRPPVRTTDARFLLSETKGRYHHGTDIQRLEKPRDLECCALDWQRRGPVPLGPRLCASGATDPVPRLCAGHAGKWLETYTGWYRLG